MSDLGQDAWTIFNNTFFSRVPSLPSPAQAFISDVPRVVDAIIFRWREVLTATESSSQPLSEHISLCVGGLRNKPYTTSKSCFSHMCDITGPREARWSVTLPGGSDGLCSSVVGAGMKELSQKVKINAPVLIYGHDLGLPKSGWEAQSLQRWLLLLLRIERSKLRWTGHLFPMPPGRLPMSLSWPGSALKSSQKSRGEVSGEKEVWRETADALTRTQIVGWRRDQTSAGWHVGFSCCIHTETIIF